MYRLELVHSHYLVWLIFIPARERLASIPPGPGGLGIIYGTSPLFKAKGTDHKAG